MPENILNPCTKIIVCLAHRGPQLYIYGWREQRVSNDMISIHTYKRYIMKYVLIGKNIYNSAHSVHFHSRKWVATL